MIRKRKHDLVSKPCLRCGTRLTFLRRPIHASVQTHARWTQICSDCITPTEERELINDIFGDILEGRSGK